MKNLKEITDRCPINGIRFAYEYPEQGMWIVRMESEGIEEFMNNSQNKISNLVSGVWDSVWLEQKLSFLETQGIELLLLLWREEVEESLLFLSRTKAVRALEFLDYMLPDSGLTRGNASCASGTIPRMMLRLQQTESMDIENFFVQKATKYFEESITILASRYGKEHKEEIEQYPVYQKKKVPWAFVKSTDVVPAGTDFFIRTLENESELQVTAKDDLYVMIGCRGELYDITRQKFESTYLDSGEVLDVFRQMLDFIPEIRTIPDGEFITIDEVAHLCYPKSGTGVYATKLEHRTKIFPSEGKLDYYLGRPGDFMAVRPDDFCDIYIIQGEVFERTYQRMEDESH